MLKILHFADVHCRDRDIDEAEKCLNFIVKTAQKEQPDLIINAGDVFDAAGIRADSLSAKLVFKIFKELADIAPVGVIIGTPSHDSTTASILKYIKARFPVYVSERPEQIYLCGGELNNDLSKFHAPIEVIISMLPAPTKQFWRTNSGISDSDAEIGNALSGIFAGFGAQAAKYDCPHILVMHCTIRGAALSESQQIIGRDIEVGEDQIQLTNANLVCCGHIHYAQAVNDKTFYSGSIFQSDFGEAGEKKGFYIHEIDNAHQLQRSKYIITPFTHLYKLTYDLIGPNADFTLPFTPENLDQIKGAVVRIEIRAYEDEVSKIDHEDLERNLAGAKSFEIKMIRVPRENVRSEKLLKLTTLREKLIEMAKLRGEEVPENILLKADNLESMEADEIVAMVVK